MPLKYEDSVKKRDDTMKIEGDISMIWIDFGVIITICYERDRSLNANHVLKK